jgi:hypothetical protein
MRKHLVIFFGAAVAVLMSASLNAHHTGATLLSEKTITVKGIVKTWLWSNPHCLLTLDVKGEDGKVVTWVMEAQAPNSIFPEGYRPNSFKAGEEVSVTINPVANGQPYGRIAQVVLANGATLGGTPGDGGRGRGRGAEAQ